MRQNKKITKKQYKTLAIIWMLASAAMAAAFLRRLAEFNLLLLLLLVMSLLFATNFWKSYKTAPEEDGVNKKLEEKNHE